MLTYSMDTCSNFKLFIIYVVQFFFYAGMPDCQASGQSSTKINKKNRFGSGATGPSPIPEHSDTELRCQLQET
jgi:hypothetical protein